MEENGWLRFCKERHPTAMLHYHPVRRTQCGLVLSVDLKTIARRQTDLHTLSRKVREAVSISLAKPEGSFLEEEESKQGREGGKGRYLQCPISKRGLWCDQGASAIEPMVGKYQASVAGEGKVLHLRSGLVGQYGVSSYGVPRPTDSQQAKGEAV
jgi:hypothetical protein